MSRGNQFWLSVRFVIAAGVHGCFVGPVVRRIPYTKCGKLVRKAGTLNVGVEFCLELGVQFGFPAAIGLGTRAPGLTLLLSNEAVRAAG